MWYTEGTEMVINEETRAKLGLRVLYTDKSEVANGVLETGSVTDDLHYYKNGKTDIRSANYLEYSGLGPAQK
jgi:hypothetical protein